MTTYLRPVILYALLIFSAVFARGQTAQTISFPTPPGGVFGTPLTLSASASSGLPVTFTVTSGAATTSGNVMTFTGTGWMTVKASQGGNATYAAAPDVSRTFSVSGGSQTISFPDPGPQAVGATVSLNATASSGLSVSYTITSGIGTLDGSQLTITNSSPVTIMASQGGNANWNGAAPVSRTISVSGAGPAITSAVTSMGQVGSALSYQIAATQSPTSFSASGLPAGIRINTSTGLISGTPTVGGTSSVVISATNSSGTGSTKLTLAIASSVGALYSQDIGVVANVGSTTYNASTDSYTVAGGGPDIWSTADAFQYAWKQMGGDYTIVAYVSSFSGTNSWSKAGVMIRDSLQPGSVNAAMIVTAWGGTIYQHRLSTDGSTTYTQESSAQPPYWVKLQKTGTQVVAYGSTDGTTWTQTASETLTLGSTTDVGLAVTSHGSGVATGVFSHVSITVAGVPPVVSSATTAAGTVSSAFNYQIVAANMPTSFNATGLAPGLSVNTTTGLISGTPTTAGTYSLSLTATNAYGTSPAAILTLTVSPAVPPPVITSSTTTSAQLNSNFSYQISASNSPTSYNATGLPAGLTVNTTNGVISGTPTASGTSSITLSATNAGGTGSATLTLTIANTANGLTGQDIGTVAYPGSTTYDSTTATYAVTGSGTDIWNTADSFQFAWQQMSGDFSVIAHVNSLSGTDSWTKAGIMIRDTLQPGAINAMVLVSKASGTSFQRRLTTGGGSTYNSGPGSPPYWLKLTKSGTLVTAYISSNGTSWTQLLSDTVNFGPTMYVGLAVTSHGVGSATGVFGNVNFTPAGSSPVISSVTTASGTVSGPFRYQIAALNTPTSFNATGLPAGLSVNTTTGLISGTPTAAGSSNVSLTASNAYGTSPAVTLALTIGPAVAAPVISSDMVVTGQLNGNFSYQIAANNSPTSYDASGLPNGLTVNTTTGLISGKATVSGSFSVTLKANNAGGQGTAILNLTIANTLNGLTTQDIGSVAYTGSGIYNSSTGTYAVTGAGADIWGTADGFQFDATQVAGDFSLVVKVNSFVGADPWAKAGLMIRDTLQAGSINAMVLVSRGNGIAFQRRLTTGGNSSSDVGSLLYAPIWLKLQRAGTLISAYESADGVTWNPCGSATVSFGTNVYAGLAVSSHGNATATATFNNLAYTAIIPTAALPYTTDFEGSDGFLAGALPQQGWTISQGAASVSTADHSSGAQSLQLTSGATPAIVREAFASATGETIEFFDFFAKPVAQTSASAAPTFVVGAAKFGFQINGSVGTLQALNGSSWQATVCSTALNANHQTQSWIRLTVRLDYTTQKWDLYANGQMVAADLGFFAPNTYLDQFQATGDTATASCFDDIYVGATNPLFVDVNNDGIDDPWETAHGLSTTQNDRAASPAGNGITVVQAYVNGTDPNDFYSGSTPKIVILGGNGQIGPANAFNLAPFDVAITDASGATLLVNAPVTFQVQSGGGSLATTNVGSPSLNSTLQMNTASDGTVRPYYKQPAAGIASEILVTAGNAQAFLATDSFLDQDQGGLGDLTDSDHDGLPDAWEMLYFGNLNASGSDDSEPGGGDGMSNLAEYMAGTNPKVNEKAGTLGTGFQLYIRTPNGSYRGVKSDWSIVPVP